MVRLKHLVSLRVECAANGERPYVALENITSWTGSLVEGIELPVRTPSRTGMASVEPGDILFGKLRPYLAKTWLVDRPALASTELMCLRPGTGVDSRWLGYLTMATPFVEWAVATSEGTKMPRTSWQKVGEYRSWLPSGSKQRAIADYLDTETGRIDALITKKRRMIELLEERWMAHAESVLSRFEPVPLKRYATKIGSGSTPRGGADVYVPSGSAFLRSQNIRGGVIDLSDVVFIDCLAQEQLRRALVRPGDVLLNITGGSIGRAAVMDRSDIQAYVSQHVCIVRSVPGVDAWVLWVELSSQSVQEQISVTQVGGNREGLNFEQVGNLLVRVPPIDQSQAIAQELATGIHASKRTTETLVSQIELLGERRRALVTSAVTGELAVSGVGV